MGTNRTETTRTDTNGWHAVLAKAGDGAFVVDGAQRIVLWNVAAETLLGFKADEVMGRRCYDIFAARDPSGCLVCCPRCPMMVMVQRGEPVPSRDLDVPARNGIRRRLNFSTLTLSDGDGVAHLFRDQPRQAAETPAVPVPQTRAGTTAEASDGTALQAAPLTRRELEVLALLARGAGTREIACTLYISRLTARNHVQHLLRKLGTSSRAAAVAIALRSGLTA